MKPRERPRTAQVVVLPPELRRYDDPSKVDGRGPGMDAYQDRAAWLAARREWEANAGMTCEEWFRAVCDEGLHRDALVGLGEAYSLYFTEDDDWEDPRLMPA
jgi:hypothetical protein